MNVLFDTNIILDGLLARKPIVQHAAKLIAMVERKEIDGLLCATTVTTIFYLVSRSETNEVATERIADLLSLFEIAAVNRSVLQSALRLSFRDFEDAVLHESARLADADAIVTRNIQDFRASSLPVYRPDELVAALSIGDEDE